MFGEETGPLFQIYIAAKRQDDRSHLVDSMIVDGFDVTAFASADDLWQRFQVRPARIVVTECRFEFGPSGLELVGRIRKKTVVAVCLCDGDEFHEPDGGN